MTTDTVYECRFTNERIRIDGRLDESAWQKAAALEFHVPFTNAAPEGPSYGRLLWDEKYLYVGIKALDKDIWAYLTERDSATYTEDVLEVFLRPDTKSPAYYNFEINPLGTVYDAYNIRRGAGGADDHRWKRWNCEGLLVGVDIKGTLNNCEDVDEYWCLEVAVPFAGLPSLKGRIPQPGEKWGFHLARYDYSVYLEQGVELSSTTTFTSTEGSFFHRWEDWQSLLFSR